MIMLLDAILSLGKILKSLCSLYQPLLLAVDKAAAGFFCPTFFFIFYHLVIITTHCPKRNYVQSIA